MAFDRINSTYPDDNLGLAKEMTDKKYATRQEIVNRFGGPVFSYNGDMVWNAVVTYREKFIYPLSLPGYSNQLFRCHLTPTIISNFITTDRVMMHYSNLFNQYYVHDYVSAFNIIDTFEKNCLSKEIFELSNGMHKNLDMQDIQRIVFQEENFAIPEIDGYIRAWNYVRNSKASSIDARFIRNIAFYLGLTMSSDIPVYRSKGVKDNRIMVDSIDENKSFYNSNGLGKIQELVNHLFSFYNTQYSLSTVTLACIVYSMFVYIAPLENYNLEVANLLFMKILDERGYGDASYTLFFDSYINRNLNQFNSYLKESKNTSDLTYIMLFVCSMAKNAMENCVGTLSKENLPPLNRGEIREIEKVVEKIVEKEVEVIKEVEVPVEVIKEVEKEVPIEVIKEVEKIVEKPIEIIKEVEKEVEIPVEVVVEKIVEKIVYREVPVYKEVEKEVPVEIIKEIPIEKEIEKIVEVIKEVEKEVPVEIIREVEKIVEKEVPVEVIHEVEKVIERPVEVIKEVEKIVEKEVPVEVIKEVEKIVEKVVEVPVEKEVVRYIEKVIEVPVETIIEKIVEVPSKREVEVIVEKEIEVPVEKEVIRYVEKEVASKPQQSVSAFSKPAFDPTALARVNVNDLSNLSDDEYAQRLLVLIPMIRKDQAYFYAHHRTEGCFYTIGQYKEYADCAYETARTSMDFLVSCGFYRKELLKNKYVYTPVSKRDSEGENN